jgi:Putative polyhydroxyalkanoic acid system protein (PHA_gran_rgn)
MRITISHNRSKADVVASVDRSFNEMFNDVAGLPVKVTVEQKTWQGSTLNFALSAKWGLMSTPVKGTVEVTDHDLTIDADLGMLERLVPEKTVHEMIAAKAKGLLKG